MFQEWHLLVFVLVLVGKIGAVMQKKVVSNKCKLDNAAIALVSSLAAAALLTMYLLLTKREALFEIGDPSNSHTVKQLMLAAGLGVIATMIYVHLLRRVPYGSISLARGPMSAILTIIAANMYLGESINNYKLMSVFFYTLASFCIFKSGAGDKLS